MHIKKLHSLCIILLAVIFCNNTQAQQLRYWKQNATRAAGNSGTLFTHQGTSDSALYNNYGVCMDASGTALYIADFTNNRVQKYTIGAYTGTTVAGATGVAGSDNSHLSGPKGVALDHLGNLYVADYGNDRVIMFTAASIAAATPGQTVASAVGTVVAGGNGEGSAANQVNNPTAVFVTTPDDTLWVSEGVANKNTYRVVKFPYGSTSATNGKLAAGCSGSGCGMGNPANTSNLYLNQGIYVDNATHTLYVADQGYSRIQMYPVGITAGTTVAGVAGVQSGLGSVVTDSFLKQPGDVIYDNASGNLIIADCQQARIMEWKPGAPFGYRVLGTGTFGTNPNQLFYPFRFCMDASKNLYVSDYGFNAVMKFTDSALVDVPHVNNLIQQVNLVPNPSKGTFNLDASVDASLNGKSGWIIITDMSGRTVHQDMCTVNNNNINKQLNLSPAIPNGIYMLQLTIGDQKFNSKFEVLK